MSSPAFQQGFEPQEDPGSPLIVQQPNEVPRSASSPISTGAGIGIGAVEEDLHEDQDGGRPLPPQLPVSEIPLWMTQSLDTECGTGRSGNGQRDLAVTDSFEGTTIDRQQTKDSTFEHTPALSWLAKPEAISRRRRNSASVSDGAPLLPPPPLPNGNGRLAAYSGLLSPPPINPLTQALSNVLHYFSLVRILTDGLAVFDSQTGRPCSVDDIEEQLALWGATALRALPNLIRGIEWKGPDAAGKQAEDVDSASGGEKEKLNEKDKDKEKEKKEKTKGTGPPLSSSEPSYADSLRQSSSVKSGKGFKAGVAKRSNLRSSNLLEETSTDTLLASASIKYAVPTDGLKTAEEVSPQLPPASNPMLAAACEKAVGLFVELLRESIVVLVQAPQSEVPTSASASPEAGKDARRRGDIGKTTAALAHFFESYESFTTTLSTQRTNGAPANDVNAQSNSTEDLIASTEKLLQCIVAAPDTRESTETDKPVTSRLIMRFTTRSAGMNALVIPVTPPKTAAPPKQEPENADGIAEGRFLYRIRKWHQFLFPHRIATWNTIVVLLMVLGCVRDTEDPMFIPCLVVGLVGVIVAFALSLSNVVEAKEEAKAEKERSMVSIKLTQVLSCCTQLPPVRVDPLDSRRSTLEGPPIGVGFVFGAPWKEDAFSPNGGGFLQSSHSPQQSIQVTGLAPGSVLEHTTTTPADVSTSFELRQSGGQPGLASKRDKQSIPSPLMLSNFVVEASTSSVGGLEVASGSNLRPQHPADSVGHTVSVEIDPTGTFLVPFLEETDPILIDGQHIHSHLAMVGLEISTDPAEVEDPYKVCLWNHAMVEATGGYSAQTALQLSLGQILADKQSLTTCQSLIDRMKVSISLTGGSPPTERFVIRVVHREQGFCRMQMTVAPVTQRNIFSGAMEMIGAVFMGIPLDPRTALSSYGFRTLYLAEVFEQFYLEVKQAKQFSSPEASVRSPTSPSGSALSRTLNEGSMGELLRFLSSLETIDDDGWESLYASSAKHLVAHAMAPQKCRVEIDDSIPAVITCDVSGISALLKLILQITGVSDFSTPTPSVSSTVPVVLTLSAPTMESAALLINVAGLPLAQLKAALDQLSHSTGVGSPNRRRELGLVLNLKELMQSLNAFLLFSDTPTANPAAGGGNLASHLQRQISMMSDSTNTGTATGPTESLFVFVPFKPTSGIQTNWLRPGGLAPSVTPAMSPGGSFRHGSLVRMHSPTEFAVSVMVAERHEIDRQKLIRALWDESHSVCALEEGLLLVEGAPILRSGLRKIEAVVFRCNDVLGIPYPDAVESERPIDAGVLGSDPLADWNTQLLQMVSEFSEVQFLCLVPRRKEKEKLNRVESAAGGLGSTAEIRHWHKMPNVHFVEVTKSSFADEVLQTLTKVVRSARKEKERREELEKLLKEHRGSTWVKGKKLGSGAFGDVFEAEMTMTGGKMAVKMIRVPKDDKRGIESVMNEVSVMCTLSHPNIVRYFYCELTSDGDQVNLFMELCKGGSLASLLGDRKRNSHPLTEQEVSTYAFQMLSAIAYIHSLGYAHRDIKPANILLNEGQLKLTDFGTARVLANQKVKETAGTFQYMAPEIVSGQEHTMSCDIWSIGCVALEMLGALPQAPRFQGSFGSCNSDSDIASAVVAELAKQKRQISKDAFSFILACLHLSADQRPTADALLTHDFILSVQRGAGAGLLRRSSTISILSTTKANQRVSAGGPIPPLPSGQSSAKKPTTVILTGDLSIRSEVDAPEELSHRALSICSDDEDGEAAEDEPAVRTENSDALNRTPPTSFPLPPKGPPSRLAKHRPEALSELTAFEEQQNVWKSTNPSLAPTPSSTRNQFPRGTLMSPAAVSRKAQSSSQGSHGHREGHSTSTAVILATPSTTMSAGAEK